jgi:hypothetical protein
MHLTYIQLVAMFVQSCKSGCTQYNKIFLTSFNLEITPYSGYWNLVNLNSHDRTNMAGGLYIYINFLLIAQLLNRVQVIIQNFAYHQPTNRPCRWWTPQTVMIRSATSLHTFTLVVDVFSGSASFVSAEIASWTFTGRGMPSAVSRWHGGCLPREMEM